MLQITVKSAQAVSNAQPLASEAQQVIQVMHRAGLFWEMRKLGTPRTLFEVAVLPCPAAADVMGSWPLTQGHSGGGRIGSGHESSNSASDGNGRETHRERRSGSIGSFHCGVSMLDAARVPERQQELLRVSWWEVFACWPHAYKRLGSLRKLDLAPKDVIRRLRARHHVHKKQQQQQQQQQQWDEMIKNMTLQDLAELASMPRARCNHGEDRVNATSSYFMNATCTRLVSDLRMRKPKSQGWCMLHTESHGSYRLGDVVERPRHQTKGAAAIVLRDFPSSIAAKYLNAQGHGANNVALLHQILRKDPRYAGQPQLEALVHIRAGDTIEGPGTPTVQFLCDRNAMGIHAFNPPLLGAYVKPLCYYESAANQLWSRGVRVIHILSGNHAPSGVAKRDTSKSCDYIQVLGAFFSQRFRVEYLLNLSADDGFAVASLSRNFVPSGGGFSALIAKMVQHKRGHVIKGGCELLSRDFADS